MKLRARAIGLFWDFTQAIKNQRTWDAPQTHRQVIRRFTMALLSGTVSPDRPNEELGLYWPSTSLPQVKRIMSSLVDFVSWCHDEGIGNIEISGHHAPTNPELLVRFLYVAHYLKNVSFMSHAKRTTIIARRLAQRNSQFPINLPSVGQISTGSNVAVKTFPVEFLGAFLQHGFLVDSSATEMHKQIDISGKMAALLMLFGGLRRSEPHHLWFNDVFPTLEGCRVTIAHPEMAKCNLGGSPGMLRSEYLRMLGLQARNIAHGNKSYKVGWKNPALDDDYTAPVYWINDGAEALFREMFIYYLRYRQQLVDHHVINGGVDHPFLLVSNGIDNNTGDDLRGAPYSYAALGNSWDRAMNRTESFLGVKLPRDKASGLTPHGGRHFYGQILQESGVDRKIIQSCLHHRSGRSQDVYTVPSQSIIQETLSKVRCSQSIAFLSSTELTWTPTND
jgi:hypothetical protein